MKKKISNLVEYKGQWMTEMDKKVRIAYNVAKRDDIIPRREKGKIIGFYIVYEGDPTSTFTI